MLEKAKKSLGVVVLTGLTFLFTGLWVIPLNLYNEHKLDNKITCNEENVPFEASYIDNATISFGDEVKQRKGLNGVRELCSNGHGKVISSKTIREPTNEVIFRGTKYEPYIEPVQLVEDKYEENSEGYAARCIDGTGSYSTGSGTCSWHGGVDFYF
jgi:hypothetical protein